MASHLLSVVAFGAALFAPTLAGAALVSINGFGAGGWYSDDTRNASGANLVGVTSTQKGKPGQTATAADDVAIASQIQFVAGPSGSTYGGAVSIDGTSANSGKSNIAVTNSGGFAAASDLLGAGFSAQYQWYGQPNSSSRSLAFKLGIQSTAFGSGAGQSQNGFTATRSGEQIWDLVLVHVPSSSDYTWSTVNLDHDTGTWALYRQAGNAFFSAPGVAKTLDDWALDATFGSLLFGAGAEVTSVQFGLGSSQRNSIAFLDYLQTSLLNGGDVIDFTDVAAAVPEPGSLALALLALAGCIAPKRQRRGLTLGRAKAANEG